MDAIISVNSLSKTYQKGKITALDNVSFTISKQDIAVFIGPDGSGKTTLLKILAGVLKPDAGMIKIAGKIGFMPQNAGHSLYGNLTVEENIDFFADLHGLNKKDRESRKQVLLKTTGLDKFKNRQASKLSGGMMQKLGVCCSLIHKPDVLILDEPTLGIDPISRVEIWKLLLKLVKDEKLTVLTSTSYMDEAERATNLFAIRYGEVKKLEHDALKKFYDPGIEEKAIPEEMKHVSTPGAKIPENAIQVRNLTKKFGNFTALNGVNITIKRGEIFGLLGPNGAGKTTLIKILIGLYRPTGGEFSVAGFKEPKKIRKVIGYMSQKFSLYTDLTVYENLFLWGKVGNLHRKELKGKIDKYLRILNIEQFKNRLVEELPLAVKQKIALISSILCSPSILFLDEPTSGVDPIERRNFWQIIKFLSKEAGITVLLTTHYMEEAEYCDKIAFINEGKVICSGHPQELKKEAEKNIGNVYEITTSDLFGDFGKLTEHNIKASIMGKRIRIYSKKHLKKQDIINLGITPTSFRKSTITMEEAFIHAIKENKGST